MGTTCACSIQLAERTNHQSEESSVVMDDVWFESVRALAELAKRGMGGIFQIKRNYQLYPIHYISEVLSDASDGTHIVLSGKDPDGPKSVAVGY